MAVLFQTERLTVRNFRPEDAADLAEILTDPDVTYFEPYETFTAEACVQEAVKLSESRELFAVVLGEKVIGKLYFSARGFGSYEVGWTLHGAYQGKGYAAESVRSLMEYAFRMAFLVSYSGICISVIRPHSSLLFSLESIFSI